MKKYLILLIIVCVIIGIIGNLGKQIDVSQTLANIQSMGDEEIRENLMFLKGMKISDIINILNITPTVGGSGITYYFFRLENNSNVMLQIVTFDSLYAESATIFLLNTDKTTRNINLF